MGLLSGRPEHREPRAEAALHPVLERDREARILALALSTLERTTLRAGAFSGLCVSYGIRSLRD